MFEIKKASKEDGKEIAALADIIWHEHFTAIIGEAQVEYMLKKFQSAEVISSSIESGEYVYYMAYLDGEFAGYIGIHEDRDYHSVLLSKIYIKKEHRKKGIAKKMINHVMNTYADAKMFWLTVNKHNDIAIAAYNKLGFTNERESVTDIGGGFVMDDYVMAIRR